jgi:hypothetical protein
VLYTSNGEQTRRYLDQGGCEELCHFRVDLGMYPSFREQVAASPFGDFYVGGHEYRGGVATIDVYFWHLDFVLGFEMGSGGRIIIS